MFSKRELFKYLDHAFETQGCWKVMPPLDLDNMDPDAIIIFGGATCRVRTALAWLRSRGIAYPFSVGA